MIDVFSGIDYVGSLLNGIGIGARIMAPYALIALAFYLGGRFIKFIFNR